MYSLQGRNIHHKRHTPTQVSSKKPAGLHYSEHIYCESLSGLETSST